ncbi:hypothetical protein DFQ28_011178 [Apophysomyces sp. BC1034]|nr:hypothetical protein DFQ28_011178 [Apophysomyces sp. BC1034]
MLVNIGSSIENSNVAVISFATFGILHATFALARLCGILALFVAIIFGHQWQPKPENGATGNDIESPHENPDEKIYEEPEDKTRSINSAAGLAASGVTGPPPAIVAGTDHAHTNPAIPVTQ